jgi:hypothetical protein
MIYFSFVALFALCVLEGFIIHRLLTKMSELENKIMSRDFSHYFAVSKAMAEQKTKKPHEPEKRTVDPRPEKPFNPITGE